ncbi:DUF433 domain-containing protein [Rhodoplanes roseus]|uniref:DUF433 domain-containing protein n=1 Tax=Rhodoplanes roseus TaxID=29409 RepID=A0A327KWT1_9BRAD|nr:DUF433 domain-containing protein [Rhodoplanes roseus]RAI43269.1 hypothetical protein CH341_15155 [Rhodoplanes roseus]
MAAPRPRPVIPTEVVIDPSVMDGVPIVSGTRIPAETIVAYLRAGHGSQDIFEDYPGLPLDGIDAVVTWAEMAYGPAWRRRPD